MGLSRAEAPYVSVPLNCVLKLTPAAFSCAEERFVLYSPPKVRRAPLYLSLPLSLNSPPKVRRALVSLSLYLYLPRKVR